MVGEARVSEFLLHIYNIYKYLFFWGGGGGGMRGHQSK